MRTIHIAVIMLGVLAAGRVPLRGSEVPGADAPKAGEETAVSRLLKYKAQERDLARAMKLIKKHQAAGAEASLLKCLEGVPEHYEAHYLLAQLAAERSDYPAAVRHMEQAEAEMDRLAGLCRAWQAERAREETAERELVSGAAQETMVKSPCAANSTKIDTGTLDRERGIAPGSGMAPLDPRRFEVPAAYHFLHGNLLYKSRRWIEAVACYRLAVERDPGLAVAWNNLLSALLLAGQGDEARAVLAGAAGAGIEVNPGLKRAVESAAPR